MGDQPLERGFGGFQQSLPQDPILRRLSQGGSVPRLSHFGLEESDQALLVP